MKDLHSKSKVVAAIPPVQLMDNTPLESQWIDTTGYLGLEFIIMTGAIVDSDADFTILMEESSVATGYDSSAVSDDDMVGNELLAGFRYDSDNQVRKIGYIGNKRYVRLGIFPSGNAAGAFLAVVAVQAPMIH